MSAGLTHKRLCQLAQAWLERPNGKHGPGCQFAFSETAELGANEIPDAIGFRYDSSVLVECKVSRSDFLADKAKSFRKEAHKGLGMYRYFMAPVGIIGRQEVPRGWGLIEVAARGLKVVAGHVLLKWNEPTDPWRHPRNWKREMRFLVRMLARISDPEMVNGQIKNAQYIAGQAIRRAEGHDKTIDKLRHEIFMLRYGPKEETAA